MDWTLPTLGSLYTNFRARFIERDENLGKMDFTGDTNLPVGFIQFSRANSRWEEWDGTVWGELDAQYAIAVATAANSTQLNSQSASYYLNCDNFTAGTLGTARIPNLDTGKITTGSFATARIPNLDAGKITTGTFGTARLDMSAISTHSAIVNKINELINARFVVTGGVLDIDTNV